MRVTALIVKNTKVLLIHRKKFGREYWVLPGGSRESGETEQEALKREIKEETSLNIVSSIKISYFENPKGIKHPIYKCEVSDGKIALDSDSPEKKKLSNNNWYHPEWVSIKKAIALKNLYPEEGKRILEGYSSEGHTKKVRKLMKFSQKLFGLSFKKNIEPIFFETRWGIHTLFVKKPIAVIICDERFIVREIKRSVKPWRILFWNPKYNKVFELPTGNNNYSNISVGESIKKYLYFE